MRSTSKQFLVVQAIINYFLSSAWKIKYRYHFISLCYRNLYCTERKEIGTIAYLENWKNHQAVTNGEDHRQFMRNFYLNNFTLKQLYA
jgi:hypothetical protein